MNRKTRRSLKLGKSGYLTHCFDCGEPFVFTPSIAMKGGHNHGYGKCISCGVDMELKVDLKTGRGISSRWPYDKPPEGM